MSTVEQNVRHQIVLVDSFLAGECLRLRFSRVGLAALLHGQKLQLHLNRRVVAVGSDLMP
jgi:hypothetical protein